jgi:hypothetical protein
VVVVAVFAVAIGIIASSGQTLINDVSDEGIFSSPSSSQNVIPITVELEDFTIIEVSEQFAILEVKFLVSNPNAKSVILPHIKYKLFEKSQEASVYTGEIGERGGGFVIGSNYITILSKSSTLISDEIIIKNTGKTPDLWQALSTNNMDWKISGEAFFNLSSMTTGGENEVSFEFTR